MDFRLPRKYSALAALGVNVAAVTTNEADGLALIQLRATAMGPPLSTLLIRCAGASVVQVERYGSMLVKRAAPSHFPTLGASLTPTSVVEAEEREL